MKKLATLGAVIGFAALPAVAQAQSKPFTLQEAHTTTQRYEHYAFGSPTPTVSGCRWVRKDHKAACSVTLTAVVLNAPVPVAPQAFNWTVLVTRDSTLGIWAGDWNYHGLTVESVDLR